MLRLNTEALGLAPRSVTIATDNYLYKLYNNFLSSIELEVCFGSDFITLYKKDKNIDITEKELKYMILELSQKYNIIDLLSKT